MSRGWPRNVAGIRWHHELYGLILGQVALPIVIIWQLISIRNVIYCTAVHASEFLRVRKFWKEQHVSRVWHWLEDLFWFRCYLVCGHLIVLVVDAVVLVLFRATTRVCTRSKQSLGHGRSCGTVNCFFIAAVCACFRAQRFDTICFHISRLFSNLFLSFSSAPKSISVLGSRLQVSKWNAPWCWPAGSDSRTTRWM